MVPQLLKNFPISVETGDRNRAYKRYKDSANTVFMCFVFI
jgi:hypothetical protein